MPLVHIAVSGAISMKFLCTLLYYIFSVSIWKKHRKIIAPSFNKKILNSYIDSMVHQCNILVQKLQDKSGKGDFDICKYTTNCSLDIICGMYI